MSTKAWIVPVRTKSLGGGLPMIVAYIAGFDSAEEAVEAVTREVRPLEGDEILGPSPVSDVTAAALRVTSNAVWML